MKKSFFLHIIIWLAMSFNLYAQSQFTNNGNLKLHSGNNIAFFGDFINNGSLIDSGNVITLAGSSAQAVGGASLTTFKNLTLNNSAGSYFTANEQIIGALNITAGTFSTTGYDFTLVSNANGTARIAPILGNFAGNITMQRYISPGVSDWRFLASPVSGVTINDWQDDFVTSGFPGASFPSSAFTSVYTYDETVAGINANGYIPATNATNPILPGKGYCCYIGPVPLTFDVTGPPNKFNQTFPVTFTPGSDIDQDGWEMIGNPYPSSIDWSSASWTKTNINGAIYVWNSSNQQYTSWIGGTGINGGTNIIASSQSFWIQTNAASPALSCTENIKVSSNTAFLKSNNSAFLLSSSIRLTITGNNFKDETLLQFGTGATNIYDADLDARKMFSSNTNVPGIATQDFSLQDLSINRMTPIADSVHIPIKTLVGVSGTYTIKIDSSYLIPSGYGIVLEDLLTGAKTSLEGFQPYTFTISDTTKTARFLLHIVPATVVPLAIELLSFEASALETQVKLNWTTASETNNSHFDIERSADGIHFEFLTSVGAFGNGNSTEVRQYDELDNNPLNDLSYYRLKQVNIDGTYKYTDIRSVVFNPKHEISINPNPAINNLIINVNASYLNTKIKIIDVLGKELAAVTLNEYSNSVNVSALPSGIYYLVLEAIPGKTGSTKNKIIIQR
jgi:hypothetical protein